VTEREQEENCGRTVINALHMPQRAMVERAALDRSQE